MGLLDGNLTDQQLSGLLMLAAASPKRTRTGIGEGLLGAYQGVQQRRMLEEDRAQKAAMQAMQMGLLGAQIDETKAQAGERAQKVAEQQRMRTFLEGLPSPQMQASQQALAGGGGPTVANAQRMPQVDPMQQMMFEAVRGGALPFKDYLTSLHKDTSPIKLGAGETLVKPGTFEALYTAPNKPAEAPSAVREYEYAKQQGYTGSFQQFQLEQRRAGAASTTVSLGSPVPVTLPDGSQALVQPANRPGEPPQIMRIPGTDTPLRPPPKELPSSMAEKFAQNAVTLQKIDAALSMLEQNPNALGVKNYAPDAIVQRIDPKGVPLRAAISDIAGQKIHDRSGAAMTVAEADRLKPYVPSATDSPETVRVKLQAFRREYAAMQQALANGASIKQAASGGGAGMTASDDPLGIRGGK